MVNITNSDNRPFFMYNYSSQVYIGQLYRVMSSFAVLNEQICYSLSVTNFSFCTAISMHDCLIKLN